MSAVPYDSHEHDGDTTERQPSVRRPRRRFFNRRSAVLAAIITCAGGFYAGISVEKSQLASTATTATPAAAAAAGPGFAGGFPGAGRFGGGAGGAGGAGGGSASIGTISSVNGNTVYLTDATGNTLKVTLSSTTELTKSLGVSKSALHPGDSVVIQGVKNSGGTLVATSVSDSGARTTGNGSGSTTSTGG